MADARFETYRDAQGKYRWSFRATNSKIIADSAEGYETPKDRDHGIALMKLLIPSAKVVEVSNPRAGELHRIIEEAVKDAGNKGRRS